MNDEVLQMEPIQVSFQYTERDCVEAFRCHDDNPRPIVDAITVLLLVAGGIYCLRFPSSNPLRGVIMAAPIYAFVRFVLPRIRFRRHKSFHFPHAFIFADDGIQVTTSGIDSHLQWSIYKRAIVSPSVCLLYLDKSNFTIVPQRVFKNEEDRRRFDQLLTKKMSSITRRLR